jgi:site-specific DNA-methyltransferase (adenine-specific)
MSKPKAMVDRIVNGDCLDIMPTLPDSSVDMVLADLPYGVTQNSWDQIIPFDQLWGEYRRVTKTNAAIVLTATQPFAAQLIASNYKMFRYDLVWQKNKSTGFLNANRMPLRQHELILVFYHRLPTYHPQKTTGHSPVNSFTKHTSDGSNYGKTKRGIQGGGQTDRHPTSVIEFPVVNNDAKVKLHPNQKPVELFEYLIRTFTDPGDVVLDNCIGSGTTAVACLNTGRHFIGIEEDSEFCRAANERVALNESTEQQ